MAFPFRRASYYLMWVLIRQCLTSKRTTTLQTKVNTNKKLSSVARNGRFLNFRTVQFKPAHFWYLNLSESISYKTNIITIGSKENLSSSIGYSSESGYFSGAISKSVCENIWINLINSPIWIMYITRRLLT